MHYHVHLRDPAGQVSVVTGHHTYRVRAAALVAARRFVGTQGYRREERGDWVRLCQPDGDAVEIQACKNPFCLAAAHQENRTARDACGAPAASSHRIPKQRV